MEAVHGCGPARGPWRVPLAACTFADEQRTRVALSQFVLNAPRLTMGEQVREFEREFAAWHQRKWAVMFSSGSCANLALLQALINLKRLYPEEDPVSVSAVTWATNVMPLLQLGFDVIPVDVDENLRNTYLPSDAFYHFPTNLLGWYHQHASCPRLLEDNCESLGARVDGVLDGVLAGNDCEASTTSFFVGHQMSTIEGGAVVTDDDVLRDMLVMVRSNGWRRDLDESLGAFDGRYTFHHLAFNFRPTEIAGFLGRRQLLTLDARLQRRRDILAEVRARKKSDAMHIPEGDATPMALPFICESGTRARHVAEFEQRGIECRPLVAGDITQQPFWKRWCTDGWDLPGARRIHADGFYCALHPDMSERDVDLVVEAVNA